MDDVDQLCGHVLELQCMTVISGVHMDAYVLTLSFAVVESFRFSFCMVFRTPRNVKPVKLKPQFFSVLFVETLCFWLSCLIKVKSCEKPSLSRVKPLGGLELYLPLSNFW